MLGEEEAEAEAEEAGLHKIPWLFLTFQTLGLERVEIGQGKLELVQGREIKHVKGPG